jgi:hypothetical protein
VVLDQKIEEMGGLFFEAGIDVLPVESLQDRVERALQAVVLLLPEDSRASS